MAGERQGGKKEKKEEAAGFAPRPIVLLSSFVDDSLPSPTTTSSFLILCDGVLSQNGKLNTSA